MCWQLEVTFQEVCLGISDSSPKQRQWSEMAIRRTTPALLLGLFLARNPLCPPANDAEHRDAPASGVVPQTPPDLLSDAGALVRQELWAHATFRRSSREPDTVKVP